MSSKPKKNRTKQYLMLLTVAGLIAIVGGAGSGTFASFNAEVSNTGNYFATGTLVLNDTSGGTTCTSAQDTSNNHNTTSPTGCATLFTVGPINSVTATLGTEVDPGVIAALDLSGLTGGAINVGDHLVLQNASGDKQTFIAAAGLDADGSLAIDSDTATYTFPDTTTTVTDITSNTQYAKLTLTNAGTLDASGISFKVPGSPSGCVSAYNEGTASLTGANLSGSVSSLSFTSLTGGGFAVGDPVVVSSGGHSQTFIAASPGASAGDHSVAVVAQTANYAYPAGATVSGPEFGGGGDLCSQMNLSIVETDSSFDHGSPAAEGCAFGSSTGVSAGLGCNIASGTALSTDLHTTSSDLTLKADAGDNNTGTNLAHGGSRYFLIAINTPLASLDNTFQNRKATFDLLWHIDQA